MKTHALFDDAGELIRYVDEKTTGAVLMKQGQMFERQEQSTEYILKIEVPIYESKNIKLNILILCDISKSKKFI